MARVASADALGQQQSFFVDSAYDHVGANSVPATLRAAGQHAYFYVDDRYWASLDLNQQQRFSIGLNGLISEFDTVIYPRSTQFWGSENIPGNDRDDRVFILFEWLNDGSGGYFQTINNYTRDVAPESNVHEMFYIDASSVVNGLAKNFIAHELQHLISFNQKEIRRNVRDTVWLNEGRGEYSGTVVGYNSPFNGSMLQRRAFEFLRTPSDSLVEWPNTSADYGIIAVFMQYLSDQYGPGTVAATIRTATIGTASIDDALSTSGTSERFDDVFVNWMLAVILNDRSQDSRYGYSSDGMRALRVTPMTRLQLGSMRRVDFSTTLKEWQPFWAQADIMPGATLSDTIAVRVAGPGNTWWRGAVVAWYADGVYAVTMIPEAESESTVMIPAYSNGAAVRTIIPMIVQTSDLPADGRTLLAGPVAITVYLDALPVPTQTPTSDVGAIPTPSQYVPTDGDLIRRIGQPDIYVIWGKYRRYLTLDTLKLYGFQNSPTHEVSDAVFFSYDASNYIRALDQKKVYAVWPDGTKHWINITAEQWDASHRDWGAIFTVNDAEVASYQAGKDIVY